MRRAELGSPESEKKGAGGICYTVRCLYLALVVAVEVSIHTVEGSRWIWDL
jgi:hypothetical protein